ncbi:MAG TPA: 4Fe-4S binding protein, partial [Burkholderiaceae bacterium]|nr:4Fe-4S binding protein [Burkholderiaceae bacterium]
GLALLAAILVLQDGFARRPKLLARVRRGFLLYTVFFIGWYALAQLSVVHVLTFLHAVMRDFRWESFLIDPMLFILWSFVALTLLLWGRGVYCGWLCPFGAIQELVQDAAQKFGLRQFEFPDVVHERLWAVKYIVLILLFGVSLQSLGDAVRYAEVEPFKTAVTLRFARDWPFVLYAGGLIAASAVNRKFFCKYLCPLGAALSIPGRFRVFDWWLRRRKECGRPCQTCANECEVRAIRPTGEINHNECHYCLSCQVTYYNDKRCMPLVERRLKRERRAAKAREPADEPAVVRIVPPSALRGPTGDD